MKIVHLNLDPIVNADIFIKMKSCDECDTPHESEKIHNCINCNVQVCPNCLDVCSFCLKAVCLACIHDDVNFMTTSFVVTYNPTKKISTVNRCFLCRK
jgi:hypothetical protein